MLPLSLMSLLLKCVLQNLVTQEEEIASPGIVVGFDHELDIA